MRFEASPARLALREFLPQVAEDETVTKAALSEVAGCDLTRRPWILLGALQDVEKSHGIEFAAITRVGYKRLPVGPRLLKAHSNALSIGRRSQRQYNNLQSIAHTTVPENERARWEGLKLVYSHLVYHAREETLKAAMDRQMDIPPPPRTIAEMRAMFAGT